MRKKNTKKVVAVIFCVILIGLSMTCMAEELPTAAYATQIPNIDGEIDDIWDTTEKLQVQYFNGDSTITGYSKVLWSEEALYLMAEVEDETLSVSGSDSYTNGVNFWISETRTREFGYPEDGDWHYFVNQDGVTYNYLGKQEVFDTAICSVRKNEKSYVVELKVPVLTDNFKYEEDNVIGFNLSIDDDVDGDNVRDTFCSWKTYAEWYWKNTADLGEVELKGAPEVEKNEQSKINFKLIGMVSMGIFVLVGTSVFVISKKRKKKF